jgi:hypothetical protein
MGGGRFFLWNSHEIAGSKLSSGVCILGEDRVNRELSELADKWMRETAALSSITEKATHPAYQQIIGMGPRAVPFLLRQLQDRGGHWFWALKAITRQDPVPVEARGLMRAMAEAWLNWGRERDLI